MACSTHNSRHLRPPRHACTDNPSSPCSPVLRLVSPSPGPPSVLLPPQPSARLWPRPSWPTTRSTWMSRPSARSRSSCCSMTGRCWWPTPAAANPRSGWPGGTGCRRDGGEVLRGDGERQQQKQRWGWTVDCHIASGSQDNKHVVHGQPAVVQLWQLLCSVRYKGMYPNHGAAQCMCRIDPATCLC